MLRVVSKENIVVAELDVLEGEHSCFIDSDESSLDDFFRLFERSFSLMPEEYLGICNLLGISGPDRIKTVPMSTVKANAALIEQQISDICLIPDNARYLKSYVRMRAFLDSMHPADIDVTALQKLIDGQQHAGVKTNLESFKKPVSVKYSMSSSATGRLSVTKGPKVLTSPNEVKSVFRSRYKDGCLLQIDLSCAEPNFALFVAGKSPIRDLYSFCANEVLDGRVDRSTAKLVLLSAIYGQSTKNLSANIPTGINAATVAKKVKDFLSIPQLQEDLRSVWSSGGLRNHLGRPLRSSKQRVLVSHYLQSSIAEASILMFESLCSSYDVTPIFIIHDAIIVDCNREIASELLDTKDFGLIYQNEKFPASITKLG
jgi:hypothetical protein